MFDRLLTISGCVLAFCLAPVRASPAQEPIAASADTAAARVTLSLSNVRLDAALDTIAAAAKVTIMYTDRIVPVARIVSVELVDVPVRQAVQRVLEGTGALVRNGSDGHLVLVKVESSGGAAGRADTVNLVGGRVTGGDSDANELIGAIVEIKGTRVTATTQPGGVYFLHNVPAGRRTLVARMIGYRPMERTVVVPDSGAVQVDFHLEMQALRLEELVTTATGPQRRLELGNQVTTIRADSIVETQPIKDLTDLLATRAPGLAVQPTTGAPGDPSRLRLRGPSSILRSNDPIVIVDGVRIHSEQSAGRSVSLAWLFEGPENAVGAPSSLDRIDPNSIATVEVLNGPSAATLYGADAANGVIVITTKRGQPGRARWDVSASHGLSQMPGAFPESYFGFSHRLSNGLPDNCSITLPRRFADCVTDSVVTYQVLNDPDLTVLGRGHRSETSLSVSGGRSDITYAITGTYSDEVGLLELPEYEVARFRTAFGRSPDEWMERPHRLSRWALSSNFTFKPAESADVGFTMSFAGDDQRRSSLEQQLSALRGVYVDRTTGLVYHDGVNAPPGSSLVPDFYRRTTNRALALRSGVNLRWRPFERVTFRADAGVSADVRRDESVLPRGFDPESNLGFISTGQGTVTEGTVNFGVNYRLPLVWGFELDAAAGFNYNARSVGDLMRRVEDQPPGVPRLEQSSEFSDDLTSYGWYVEPRIGNDRFFISAGLRLDGGSNYGSRVSGFDGFRLPKLGFSWLISEEPFFPFKDSWFLNSLRIRAAYGQAGVQPGATDRLRLYSDSIGQGGSVSHVVALGNTRLRPERSTEIEGGFEVDLLDRRLWLGLTGYRKTKNDALVRVTVPPSVNGGSGVTSTSSVLVNVGVVRNTGFELTMGTELLRTDLVQWNAQVNLSRNRNVVVSLADGLEDFGGNLRVVPGFPLFGFWERPILGFADANGDGVVVREEVLVGDSLAFLGTTEPDYIAGIHTSVGLLGGAVTVAASFDYQDGFAQMNQAPGGPLGRATVDPSAPLADQAFVVSSTGVTDYGLVQTVSVLRFNSLSVGWRLPGAVVRWVGAERGTLHVQGTNLGLSTNYRGKDPRVNSFATGNAVVDAGALPQPREWRVRIGLSY